MNELVVMNSLSDRISTHFEGVEEKNVVMAYVFIPETYS